MEKNKNCPWFDTSIMRLNPGKNELGSFSIGGRNKQDRREKKISVSTEGTKNSLVSWEQKTSKLCHRMSVCTECGQLAQREMFSLETSRMQFKFTISLVYVLLQITTRLKVVIMRIHYCKL